jgi:mono/diheme cytochrome c family protein
MFDFISVGSFVRGGMVIGLVALSAFTIGCEPRREGSGADDPALRVAGKPAGDSISVERGRYLVRVTGCNDCHTPGFMQQGEAIPESQWLTGVPVGWRGPWGTTYGSNLRRFVKDFDEETFMQVVRARNGRPPMPWTNLHAMNDADLRSLFRYMKSLPVTGDPTPEYVPPGVEPKTPYVDMMPRAPKAATPSS